MRSIAGISRMYTNYLPASNPGVKLVWVNTTARRIKDNVAVFEEHNQGVINRNKAVGNFTRSHSITLLDFYSISVNHPEYYETDGIHFNKEGVDEEARFLSDEVIKVIENSDYRNK